MFSFLRRIKQARTKISIIDYMHRWLDIDNDVQQQLRLQTFDNLVEGVEEPLTLRVVPGAAEGLDRLQLKNGEVGVRSGDGVRFTAESEEIVSRHPEDAG